MCVRISPIGVARLPCDPAVDLGAEQMRIGVIASIAHRVRRPSTTVRGSRSPPPCTEGFVARGHEVTLFATANSLRPRPGWSRAGRRRLRRGRRAWTPRSGRPCIWARPSPRAGEFDMLSNQFDFMPLSYSRLVETPMVTTIHGFSSEQIVPVYAAYDDDRPLRRHQRRRPAPGPDLRRDDPPRHRHRARSPSPRRPEDYLLFLGRIHPDKGTHRAIEVARRAGLPLVIAGIIQDQALLRRPGRAAPRRGGGQLSSARSGRPSGTGCSVRPAACCT